MQKKVPSAAFPTQAVAEVMEALQTSKQGLSTDEAQKRLEQYGQNALLKKKKKPAWLMFFLQFKDFMIFILIVAAFISGALGEWVDTIVILIIVILNALVGFLQEYRAEKALDALQKMSVSQSQVMRDGQALSLDSVKLVPGDLVILEAGDVLSADLRLAEALSLRMDESTLTGESVPVDKTTDPLPAAGLPLGDQTNMAFKGALITGGRGLGFVVATGMQTELGQIAQLLQADEVETPLKQRMKAFSKQISYIVLLICLILVVAGLIRGEEPWQLLLLAISLAVAAIPEALPALITIALAQGANRMAKQNALVRKLPAVETLGSVSYICTDKTGTLTLNKMTVVHSQAPEQQADVQGSSPLLLAMALNHNLKPAKAGDPLSGDPTEVAIVEEVIKQVGEEGLKKMVEQYPRLGELPFDSERKRMTTVHPLQDKFLVLTKGAAESVADILTPAAADNKKMESLSESWAAEGLRVLALGYKIIDKLPEPLSSEALEHGQELAGLVGMIDPPREEAKTAIAECKQAGIRPVMITGDHPATALTIAREIGIYGAEDAMLTGLELEELSEVHFRQQVEKTSVYARVSPSQKLRIVKALQDEGNFVAMTGDGVNDAPSLRAANIGVAMGINGTDVSKEAAHMILLDDNFATIVKAVKEGRRIYDNIRKFVKYIMTCNSAEIWTIFLAPLLGLPMPLLPIHILWINLVTDGLPGLALASEKAEPDIMQRPPRPAQENLFAQGMGYHVAWVGLFMAGLTLGAQAWSIKEGLAHWQSIGPHGAGLQPAGPCAGHPQRKNFFVQAGDI